MLLRKKHLSFKLQKKLHFFFHKTFLIQIEMILLEFNTQWIPSHYAFNYQSFKDWIIWNWYPQHDTACTPNLNNVPSGIVSDWDEWRFGPCWSSWEEWRFGPCCRSSLMFSFSLKSLTLFVNLRFSTKEEPCMIGYFIWISIWGYWNTGRFTIIFCLFTRCFVNGKLLCSWSIDLNVLCATSKIIEHNF